MKEGRINRQRNFPVRANRAFTTVELLVALALLLIVGGLSVVTFQVASKSRRQAMARIDVAEKSRIGMEMMSEELGSAILNQVSLFPFPEGRVWSGRYEDLYSTGVGQDDDNDGLVDEEEISFIGKNMNRLYKLGNVYYPLGDRLDNDGPPTPGSGVEIVEVGTFQMRRRPVNSPPINGIDEEVFDGIDNDGDGMIDEDCAFPSDMLNFVVPRGTVDFTYSLSTNPLITDFQRKPVYDLVEVGYAIDPSRQRLMRRYIEASNEGTGGTGAIDGRFLIDGEEGNETEFVAHSEVFAFDVVGLDFRYYFFDYQVNNAINNADELGLNPNADDLVFQIVRLGGATEVNSNVPGGRAYHMIISDPVTNEIFHIVYPYPNSPWAYTEQWRSDRRDISPGWDGPVAPTYKNLFQNINNEPNDAVSIEAFKRLASTEEARELFSARRQETDGLPAMVEITIFSYDRQKELRIQAQYTSRVYIAQR